MELFLQFVLNHWVLWSALIIIVALLVLVGFEAKLRGIEVLSPQQATLLLNRGATKIIDVRDAASFAKLHIAGASQVPLAELSTRLEALKLDKNQPVLIVDANGQQAMAAALKVQKNGYTAVKVLRHGIAAWQASAFPTRSS